jgi:DNA-binding NarL/FixJ family response regulator
MPNQRTRATILLLAERGCRIRTIARALQLSRATVRDVIHREQRPTPAAVTAGTLPARRG